MTPRIQKAIDIFLDAINNGTLAKGTCTACAVGNLVAHGMGATITRGKIGFNTTMVIPHWGLYFSTSCGRQHIDFHYEEHSLPALSHTDFTISELMTIEYAFETNTGIHWQEYRGYTPSQIRADQIRGLEAVVRVMLEFDEQPDKVKEVFTQKADLIPV